MADCLPPAGAIPASVPDDAVPAEKLETQTAARQKTRRAGRFLKGPIPLPWIRQNVRDPADRLLLVLLAYADMQQSTEIKITAGIRRDAGISNRKAAYRAVAALEASGVLIAQRHRGRCPVIRLMTTPARKMGVI
ncbi:uncharacterized protein METZ01_LOCUS485783 [marine metagenome]|uniref:Helix-turn-helix domain-containing protein n=1 Tax=marine metagenome TaxID=408172 RepID=A0A383CLK4_9ZZZZ